MPSVDKSSENYENLAPRDGELFFVREFLCPYDASILQQQLLTDLEWDEETIVVVGKQVKVPRLVCWYGDPQACYKYSGTIHNPIPWTSGLKLVKTRIEKFSENRFNSVLGNLYRNGTDSMGWHADKEKELGIDPFIASLSLGETRLFKLRHNKSKETINLYLSHGSLLLMGGNLQSRWRHSIPKSRKATHPRINLTFRYIFHL